MKYFENFRHFLSLTSSQYSKPELKLALSRYLGTLKSYVRNRSRPEGCIAEGYLAEECLNFCSLYLADYVETKFNRTSRNDDVGNTSSEGFDVFSSSCRPLGKGTPKNFIAMKF